MTSVHDPVAPAQPASRHLDEGRIEEARRLLDVPFYAAQAGRAFPGPSEALRHYLTEGAALGLNPHPLFDGRHYLAEHPEVAAAATNPLVHYLEVGAFEGFDPSPYFDTEYYFSQHEKLARRSVNALLHYVEYGPEGRSCNPNPLFGNGYYLAANPRLRGGNETPFGHYLRHGRFSGRPVSKLHESMLGRLGRSERSPLRRGACRGGRAVFLVRSATAVELALRSREIFSREHALEPAIVSRGAVSTSDEPDRGGVLVLDEFRDGGALRPAALRLLALDLASSATVVFTDLEECAEAAGSVAPSYFLLLDSEAVGERSLPRVAPAVNRVIFGSHRLASVAAEAHALPHNVAVRAYDPARPVSTAESFVRSLVELARRDVGLELAPQRNGRVRMPTTRTILVPCPDWAVSGVNSALEAVGQELLRCGWEIEILFTRDREAVEHSAAGHGLPRLPYRFLERKAPGVEGMWEAVIAELERQAPCILFMAYDFVANSVVPALTENVGAVMWLQADDGDYYEQAYRLGRYCNGIVCVSSHIRDVVSELHPGIGARSRVIHNTSISDVDVAEARSSRSDRLRIVYTGRLVQYQKRILDFVDLADALEARGVPFEIALIGDFAVHDEAAGLFPKRAARHLEQGTIVLVGRLSREAIFERLRRSDFFVLLSDFEGLPLSLVEAMAAGCVPVVADMKSGIAEVLSSGENGTVVAGRDYGRWADVLVELWRDPVTLAEMSRRARTTVRESFTVERIAQQFDELFRQVADEIADGWERPAALHWGERRSGTGDVLPPPFMFRPVPIAGLG